MESAAWLHAAGTLGDKRKRGKKWSSSRESREQVTRWPQAIAEKEAQGRRKTSPRIATNPKPQTFQGLPRQKHCRHRFKARGVRQARISCTVFMFSSRQIVASAFGAFDAFWPNKVLSNFGFQIKATFPFSVSLRLWSKSQIDSRNRLGPVTQGYPLVVEEHLGEAQELPATSASPKRSFLRKSSNVDRRFPSPSAHGEREKHRSRVW